MWFVVPLVKYGWERCDADLNASVFGTNGTLYHPPAILNDYDY